MGTAAHLSVFESVLNTLRALDKAGYQVELPESVDALRESLLVGNAEQYGAEANVHATISVDDHVTASLISRKSKLSGARAGQALDRWAPAVCSW